MRAVPSPANMPRWGSLPRLVVSAAAATAVLHQTKKARGRLTTGKTDYSASAQQQETLAQTSKASTQVAAVAAATSAAAAGLLPQWGLLLPSLIAVGLSWLGVLYSTLGPIKSWMVAAVPGLVQLADMEHHTEPAVEMETVQAFCGTWVKDVRRSDSMDGFCQLFGVPRWLRQATRLMAGLEISLSGDTLLVKQVCKLSWLSTSEAFPVDGLSTAPQRRRDMRSGECNRALLNLAALSHMALPRPAG
ncbi:hypothetical protein COO60DRAFT_1514225 [Scenedesmus sp. NREL 46B-D3]|nr:hypothetical protein COO60DRAFT_1514225 [Scenedesmus sp. NREL 46B-D3]